MSTDYRAHRGRTPRGVAAGVPAALAGSIALVLTAAPANAAESPLRRADAAGRPRRRRARRGPALARRGSPLPPLRRPTPCSAATPSARSPARYGLRTADVLALNGLGWRSVIYPGQVLRLIGTAPAAPAPAAPSRAAPVAASGTYTVQRGDTISAIAKRHGVSTQSVLAANGLGWSSIIRPGQILAIAGRRGSGARAAPPPRPPRPPLPLRRRHATPSRRATPSAPSPRATASRRTPC